MNDDSLPKEGLVRLSQIIGYSYEDEEGRVVKVPGVIPVSKSTWWDGIKKGIYPKGRKLSARCTVWDVADIRKIIKPAC